VQLRQWQPSRQSRQVRAAGQHCCRQSFCALQPLNRYQQGAVTWQRVQQLVRPWAQRKVPTCLQEYLCVPVILWLHVRCIMCEQVCALNMQASIKQETTRTAEEVCGYDGVCRQSSCQSTSTAAGILTSSSSSSSSSLHAFLASCPAQTVTSQLRCQNTPPSRHNNRN